MTYRVAGNDAPGSQDVPLDTPITQIRYSCTRSTWGDSFRGLSSNQVESLQDAGISTVGDLEGMTHGQIKYLRGFGDQTASHIERACRAMGINFYGKKAPSTVNVVLPSPIIDMIISKAITKTDVADFIRDKVMLNADELVKNARDRIVREKLEEIKRLEEHAERLKAQITDLA